MQEPGKVWHTMPHIRWHKSRVETHGGNVICTLLSWKESSVQKQFPASIVTFYSRTAIHEVRSESLMKWSFRGLATTLKVSAGQTALPHSSMYLSKLHRANEYIIITLSTQCLVTICSPYILLISVLIIISVDSLTPLLVSSYLS